MNASALDKKRILLVDDDPSLLANIGQFLKFDGGYDVSTANSGESAIEVLKTYKPNLIILDMSMPGMGGMGFLKAITGPSGKPSYPVLVLTAKTQMAEMFADIEVDGFLAKPTEPEDLLDEVSRIMFLCGSDVLDEPEVNLNHIKVAVNPKKIVVADQDDASLAAISGYLSRRGFMVDSVKTGPAAIERSVAIIPDLIVLRADLALVDGFSILGLMRQMQTLEQIPVVLYGIDGIGTQPAIDEKSYTMSGNDPEKVGELAEKLFAE